MTKTTFLSLLLVCGLSGLFTGCQKPADKPAVTKNDDKTKSTDPATKPAEPAKPATDTTKPVDPPKPMEPSKPAEPMPPAEPMKAVEPAKPMEPAKPAEPMKPVDPPKPVEPAKPAEPAPATTEMVSIKLGDPSLTAGIPGEGDLTVEQIKAWLDNPENHKSIKPILPLGLDKGAGQEKGLAENPLTKAKIELGRQLYFDTRLSKDNTVSCASCHAPDFGYAKDTQFGVGINGQMGGRNSPTAYNRILSSVQFWDGRAASLEEQAKGPIQNPIEMGNTHEAAVATVKGIEGYRLQFEKVFGADSVNIDNIAKAIASFERAIVTGPSPFDYNEVLRETKDLDEEDLKENPEVAAKVAAAKEALAKKPMSESAQRGRELFFGTKASCTACHVGPNLSDELYHNLGVGMMAEKPDLGRFDQTKAEKDKGAFKTPTIRNVAQTAPYMHDGSQKTLAEVVEWYAKGGHPNPTLSDKIKKLELTDQDKADLVAFMEACTGELPKVATGRLPVSPAASE